MHLLSTLWHPKVMEDPEKLYKYFHNKIIIPKLKEKMILQTILYGSYHLVTL